MQYINELLEGQNVSNIYFVKSKEIRQKRDGTDFLSVELQDKTGTMSAKMWDNVPRYKDSFEKGDFIWVWGTVGSYKDELQITIQKIRPLESKDVEDLDKSDYFEVSEADPAEMWARLLEIVKDIKADPLRQLVEKIFQKYEKRIQQWSGARTIHHPYISGFLEHTLSVTESCLYFAEKYKPLDRDLLVTAAILHDIGKLEELTHPPETEYTPTGVLEGHLILGRDIVRDAAREIEGFPQETLMLLGHMVLSHQGELEFGSPKRPKTVEALILHYADDLDAKLNIFRRILKTDKNAGAFTRRDTLINRAIYKGNSESPP